MGMLVCSLFSRQEISVLSIVGQSAEHRSLRIVFVRKVGIVIFGSWGDPDRIPSFG